MKQIDDTVFEALFRQVIIDDYNEEIDSIFPKEKLAEMISFSPEFELKMKRLIAREQQRDILIKVIKYIKRTAAVFIVVTTVFFYMMLFNHEVRAVVKNTVIKWYDKFTSFIFQGEPSDTYEQNEWEPKYLPEGYHENSVEKLGMVTNIEYANDQGDIIYLSYRPERNDTNISVDNENHKLESGTINGHEGYIAKATKNDFDNGVIWSMDKYTFNVWSKLPIDEIIKIAQSISKHERHQD